MRIMYAEEPMENPRSHQTMQHVIRQYVQPARSRGERTIQVRVGTVQKELGWNNRTPSIFSTLGSRKFQQEAGLELIDKQDGPPSGGPSTTVRFIYKILTAKTESRPSDPPTPNGAGLRELSGILAESYRQLGGGEQYLKSEREALRFPAEAHPRFDRRDEA